MSTKPGSSPHEPKRWWQWVLLYPALLVSVVAAVPTYIEAFRSAKIGVQYGESGNALKQADLWQRNLSCTSAPLDPLVTPNNTKVDATICKTGDVLVKVFTPGGDEFYRWVGVDSVVNSATAYQWNHLGQAYAAGLPLLIAKADGVKCQKLLGIGKLLRRVEVSGKGCFDEVVNVFTGKVLSKKSVKCSTKC